MRYQTELMKEILTNEKAQEIINYVTYKYGNSYVGLWIFQVMGIVLGEVYDMAQQLRYETVPATSDLLLEMWEKHYKIATDSTLSKEQRQLNLATKTSYRGPCNPARLEKAISSALGGAKVEITENIAKNTFLVNIREVVGDIKPAVSVLERMKPSHLIYRMQVATQMVAEADLKVAIAITHAEMNTVRFYQDDNIDSFSMDANGTLISVPTPSVTDDGTLVFENAPTLLADGTLEH